MSSTTNAHLHLILEVDGVDGAVVDGHGAFGKTVLFLHLAVHEEQRLGELWRALVQRLLKQISRAFNLVAALSNATPGSSIAATTTRRTLN